MLILAHRSNHDGSPGPENTLAAVRHVWTVDPDGIELDIHLTRDGRIVVIHDHDTAALGEPALTVADCTLDELRTARILGRDGDYRPGERVPTLEEMLDVLPDGKRVYVEIKAPQGILEPLEQLFASRRLGPSQVTFISFLDTPEKQACMCGVREAFPAFPLLGLFGQVDASGIGPMIDACQSIGASGVDMQSGPIIDAELSKRLRSENLSLHVWLTGNYQQDASVLTELARAGLDSITTDRPGWVSRVLGIHPQDGSSTSQPAVGT